MHLALFWALNTYSAWYLHSFWYVSTWVLCYSWVKNRYKNDFTVVHVYNHSGGFRNTKHRDSSRSRNQGESQRTMGAEEGKKQEARPAEDVATGSQEEWGQGSPGNQEPAAVARMWWVRGVDGRDPDEEVGWATISKVLKHAIYRLRSNVRETRESVQWAEFPWQSQEDLSCNPQHTYFQKTSGSTCA